MTEYIEDEIFDEDRDVRREPLPGNPRIVTRDEHNISRAKIDRDAIKVLYRLHHSGYRAFLVGGGVRDLLLGRQPKDFDVGTDAQPNEVRRLFKNSRPIGKRFRLVQVFFRGNKIVEVSTFRASSPELEENEETPLLAADNTFGDPESDAKRRDLTINGLFYDIATFSIIDYVGGVADLEAKIIRIIGNPAQRIQEDPIRMIRAVRHAARTSFTIEPETLSAIRELGNLLPLCPKSRIMEEFLRELKGGYSWRSFALMEESGLLSHLLPFHAKASSVNHQNYLQQLGHALRKVDFWVKEGTDVQTSVIFAALLCVGVTEEYFKSEEGSKFSSLHKYFFYDGPSSLLKFNDEVEEGDAELIRELCRNLFGVIGIYRRDVDGIVRLLKQRKELLASYHGDIPIIRNLGQFRDAISFLETTAWDEDRDGAVGFWRQKLGQLFMRGGHEKDQRENRFHRSGHGGGGFRPRRRRRN